MAAAAAKLTAALGESVADRGRSLLECLAEVGALSGFGREMGTLLDEALRGARIELTDDGAAPRRPDQWRGVDLASVALERAPAAPRSDSRRPRAGVLAAGASRRVVERFSSLPRIRR